VNVALRVVLFSALLAALPALVVGMAAIEVPAMRSAIEARVCGPDETILFRMRRTPTGESRSAHCRTQDGQVRPDDVTLATLWAGTRLTWPPLTGVVAVVWWGAFLLRQGRGQSGTLGRPAPVPAAGPAARAGPAAANVRRVERTVAPSITRTTDEVTVVLGDEHAALVERLVSSERPSLDDVQSLLGSMRAAGALPDDDADARVVDLAAGEDVAASLRRLDALRDQRLISRTEYEERRRAILERI